jgi:superfamily II DNA or RNA helicase
MSGSTLIIGQRDETHVHLASEDSGMLMEISEFFTFMVPGYKWMPLYKNKLWDGKCRLFNSRTGLLPRGLLQKVIQFCEDRNYQIEAEPQLFHRYDFTDSVDQFADYAKSLKLSARGEEIDALDYQIDAYSHAITNKRAILLSPTGSGKSLMIYLIIRWFLEYHAHKKRVIIIVPTVSLVEQMFKDFDDYSRFDDSFSVEKTCHRIYSGKDKTTNHSVIITTWQSAIAMRPDWFLNFGLVVGDEAHLFKAKSLTTIMDRLKNAEVRIGTTGTLDGSLVHEMVLEGAFGPVKRVTTTKDLIDSDRLAKLVIYTVVLKYTDAARRSFGKKTYQEEIDYIVSHSGRNRFIVNLTADQTGNTLVLYNLVAKHGKPLFEMLRKKLASLGQTDSRRLFFVSGSVDAEEREKIREITEKEKNAIIVASMGTFSTGINIRNLHNVVFASPTKSQVRVLQSIGRGLRKSDDGRATTVFDLSDDLSWKKKKNYTLDHGIERVKIYSRERLPFKVAEVPVADE